jgi:hypothetical protein
MAFNIGLRTKKVAEQINIFDSTMVRWVTGGVTIDHTTVTPDSDGRKRLPVGTPLGKITATGKYGPWDTDATDGRQTAVCMLGENVDFELDKSGKFGDQVATAFDWARVISDRLPIDSADLAALKAQLPNITFA